MALSGQFKNTQTIVRFHGEEQKDYWIVPSEAVVVGLSPALSFFIMECINDWLAAFCLGLGCWPSCTGREVPYSFDSNLSMRSLPCHTILMGRQWIINAFQDSLLVSIRSLDFPGAAATFCQVWCRYPCWHVQPGVLRRKHNWFCLEVYGHRILCVR